MLRIGLINFPLSESFSKLIQDIVDTHAIYFYFLSLEECSIGTQSASIHKPQLSEVARLLKEKSSSWSDIGEALGVPFDFRESLRNDLHYTSDFSRLEKVLNEWLTTSEQRKVTWEEFLRALKSLNYNDIVDKTN